MHSNFSEEHATSLGEGGGCYKHSPPNTGHRITVNLVTFSANTLTEKSDSFSGHFNKSDRFSGHFNKSDRFSGHFNKSDRFSVHFNKSDSFSGHFNKSGRFSGHFNKSDRFSGHFKLPLLEDLHVK